MILNEPELKVILAVLAWHWTILWLILYISG